MNEGAIHAKDANPDATVALIEKLLSQAGLETNYTEFEKNAGTCYASRVTLKEPNWNGFGSNGKGISPILCKASAYAELMERLQNSIFAVRVLACDPDVSDTLGQNGRPALQLDDEVQPRIVQNILDRLAVGMPKNVFAPDPIKTVKNMLKKVGYSAKPGVYTTRPYYSIRDHAFVDLPYELLNLFFMSNGMAAGNTVEEALVQAMSEIMERYSERTILKGEVIAPEIPKEVIHRYPTIEGIIANIESDPRYSVRVLDCTLGKGIPSVCGIIFDSKLQSFGLKFGSHPRLDIALERVFSETFQGNTLQTATKNSHVSFAVDATSRVNNWNLLKVGVGTFPASLLGSEPSYAFKDWEDVSTLSNKELMQRMIAQLKDMGADIYITDVSYLGFPSVQVYASGISEGIPVDLLELKQYSLMADVYYIFRKQKLTPEDLKKVILLTRLKAGATLENSFSMLSGINDERHMHGYPAEAAFLQAACHMSLGEWKEAEHILQLLCGHYTTNEDDDAAYVRNCQLYAQGMTFGKTQQQIRDVLYSVSPKKIADQVMSDLSEPMEILHKMYPFCPDTRCAECTSATCVYPRIKNVFRLLTRMEREHPMDQQRLEDLLKEC